MLSLNCMNTIENISVYQAPWIIIIVVLLYGVVHSVLATLKVKDMARLYLGIRADRTYRLFYNLIALLTFLPVLALLAILPDERLYSIPFPWVLLTTVIQGLAIITLFLGLLQTGLWSFLGIKQLFLLSKESQTELVVHGLYRRVRHPLYMAGLLFIWFSPVMTHNTLAMTVGLSVYLILGALVEERKLIHEYGAKYLQYQEHTPMLVPVKIRVRK